MRLKREAEDRACLWAGLRGLEVSHLNAFPLGAPSPILPGAINSLESPWPEAAEEEDSQHRA